MPDLFIIFSQIILIVSANIRGSIDTTTHLFCLGQFVSLVCRPKAKNCKPPSVAFTQYADPNRVVHGQPVIWIVIAIDHKMTGFA